MPEIVHETAFAISKWWFRSPLRESSFSSKIEAAFCLAHSRYEVRLSVHRKAGLFEHELSIPAGRPIAVSNRMGRQVSRYFSMIRPLITFGLLLFCCWPVFGQDYPFSKRDPNSLILSLLNMMPKGGGYSATAGATRDLQSAVQVREGKLLVRPTAAQPTYCSGATYLVFVQAIETLLPESPGGERLADALAIKGQPDGVGVWGRWNANGPGTACLFRELRLGHNFTSIDEARPGDFMKIFWTDAVGTREHGHSVIYLGRASVNGVETIRFWSSNKPGGYGEKAVPRSRVFHAIFSRLEAPSNIEGAVSLQRRNEYLAGLIARESSIHEALDQSGITEMTR